MVASRYDHPARLRHDRPSRLHDQTLQKEPPIQPNVAAGLVKGFADFAAGHGVDRAALLRRAGLLSAPLDDPDARVALTAYLALIRAGCAATGISALALRYGAQVPMWSLSVLGLIMEASATMGEAFRQLQRYGRIVADVAGRSGGSPMELVAHSGRLHLVYGAPSHDAAPHLVEIAFAQLTCGPRRFLTGPHVKSVQLDYPAPGHCDEYDEVFRCPVRFDAGRNALELAPDVADWPVAPGPNPVLPTLARHADNVLVAMDRAGPTETRVRAALRPILARGSVTAETVAGALGCSRQTLHRRLSREGTTFSRVLGDLRAECAAAYLSSGEFSVGQVAFLVGFSEAAAFSRAFKRWSGRSPAEFRNRLPAARTGPPSVDD